MSDEYQGFRRPNGDAVVRRLLRGWALSLPPRLDLDNHSPTGFEWGYSGSGPAQLALAILADALGSPTRALRLHQQFKWKVISGLERDASWSLSRAEVLKVVEEIEREEAA
jgi:hypothetical protein